MLWSPMALYQQPVCIPPNIPRHPQTSPNSFSLSRLPHTGWTGHGLISSEPDSSINALVMHDITALPSWPERWTMPPLFCLLTLAVMAFKNCKTQYRHNIDTICPAMSSSALHSFRYCCSMSQWSLYITLRPPRVGQLHGRPQLHAWHAMACPCYPHSTAKIWIFTEICCAMLCNVDLCSVRRIQHFTCVPPFGVAMLFTKDTYSTDFDRFIFKYQQITHWIRRSWTSCRGFACWNCPSETVIATCTETGPKAWRNISWHSLTMLDIEWPIWYNSCFRRLDFLFNLLQPPISHGTSREPVCSTDSASCNTLWDTALGYLWNDRSQYSTFRTGSQWNVYSISQDIPRPKQTSMKHHVRSILLRRSPKFKARTICTSSVPV